MIVDLSSKSPANLRALLDFFCMRRVCTVAAVVVAVVAVIAVVVAVVVVVVVVVAILW